MNILLIGGAGSFIDQLIRKFKKEGHRVFLLTGDPYKKQDYEHVFEKYRFAYDSVVLGEVIESINPDVTICMGAFDTNYDWREEEREAVAFTSHLMNIFVMHAKLAKKKIILLSSDEVYQESLDDDITEDIKPYSATLKGRTLIQGERLCEDFREHWDMDTIVLRLDHLHGIPKKKEEVQSICAKMCLQGMQKGYIEADMTHEFSVLSENDAVEYIYQAVKRDVHKHAVYHLSGDDVISEVAMAGIIEEVLGESTNIVVKNGLNGRKILSGERFEQEYGVHTFSDAQQVAKAIALNMKKNKKVFLEETEQTLPWWKRVWNKWKWLLQVLIPFAENLLCFIPFFMLNNRTVGSEYFANLDPYLIYVLLFAIIYGQQQATFSAICAVAGYMFRQMYNRTGFDIMLDYNTYVWIAQLFILGLVIGYMRDQIRSMKIESKELEEHLQAQVADVKEINTSNVRVKGIFEQQLIDHKDSIGKIYNITSKLEQQMPEDVLFDAVEMLKELMHTEDVAIYNVMNKDYARIFSASSERARSLGNSIEYKKLTEIYNVLSEQKVYINKQMDDHYPLMAKAIYEDGEIKMIIMLWGLSWEQMTLGQANFLTISSYLIQNAVLRARRYMNALEEVRYAGESGILSTSAFESLVSSYYRAKDKDLVECTLLKIEQSSIQVGKQIQQQLRSSDYVGTMSDGKIYVLLANTSVESAYIVQERIARNGYITEVVEKY